MSSFASLAEPEEAGEMSRQQKKNQKKKANKKKASAGEDDAAGAGKATPATPEDARRAEIAAKVAAAQKVQAALKLTEAKAAAEKQEAADAKTKRGAALPNKAALAEKAAALRSMTPEQMRAQAAALRTTPPAQLRQNNAAFASMSNAEIAAAADELDAMADDPTKLEAAAGEMSALTRDSMQAQLLAAQRQRQVEAMKKASPEALLKQADAIRTCDNAKLRKANAAFSRMTDVQIAAMADQLEAMAKSPEMRAHASAEMETLTPEKARAMQDAERAKATLQSMDAEATAACAGAMLEANPEELLEQAAAMRADPAATRASVPSMAKLTDEQIRGAADNLEKMARDPKLRAETASKMSSMAEKQSEDLASQYGIDLNAEAAAPAAAAPSFTEEPPEPAAAPRERAPKGGKKGGRRK